MIDLERLRDLAAKASERSPWELNEDEGGWRIEYGPVKKQADPTPEEPDYEYEYRDAILDDAFGPALTGAEWRFIAAASPSVVLELVEEVERLRETFAGIESTADDGLGGSALQAFGALTAVRDSARRALEGNS